MTRQKRSWAGGLAQILGAACLAVALGVGLGSCGRSGEQDRIADKEHRNGEQAAVSGQAETERSASDPYLWLEEIQGEKALAWVKKQNDRTLKVLTGDSRYQPAYGRILGIYQSPDRIAYGQLRAGHVDNFWQDRDHVRGLWRRTTLASYKTDAPEWEVLLDIDKLAAEEGENWVWKGASCLPPAYTRCLVSLSRGGGDAVVVREFDTTTKRFVSDGFQLPEGKQWLAWLDADHLLVASPHAGGMKNRSGYPRTIRIWKRGEPLAKARTLFTGAETDAFVFPVVEHGQDGRHEAFVVQAPDFFHQTVYHLGSDGRLQKLPLPADVDFKGLYAGQVIVQLRSAWALGDTAGRLAEGSVVSIPLAELAAGDLSGATTVMAPNRRVTVRDATIGRNGVYVAILDNVKGRLVQAVRAPGGWRLQPIRLPADGTVSVVATDPFTDAVLVNYESFLKPDTLYVIEGTGKPQAIKALAPRFDAGRYVVDQFFAESEDGTKVPYFLIRRKDMPHNATTPTILYGYGGFEIALTPQYLSPMAIEWLEAGGAYVVANIRGGGEFGPRWHRAALKENRPKAYADFAAVAYDLVARRVTTPKRLGIYGRSNGGLLVTATMVRYPELFGAVAAGVPLTDMLRYHKLLAGASWIGEYGDPDKPEERAFIATYSPYQNLKEGVRYPPIFFITSTLDDRVHPGHARKMAARMMALNQDVLYYENTQGGHAGAANLPERARYDSLILVFMLRKLADPFATDTAVPATESGRAG